MSPSWAPCPVPAAVMPIEGATDTAVFRAYVEQVVISTLAAGDIVAIPFINWTAALGMSQPV
jgi:hypothetical protein